MASNSGWTIGLPSGQSKVSTTDEEFRSLKSYVENWLEDEHYVKGGSSSSAGVHRLGSARAFVGTTSQLSNPTGDNSGRLFFTSDNTGLYVAHGSASTWKQLTNSITLGSNNSWTGTNQFSNAILSDLTINPPGGGWNISGITSGVTTLVSTVTIAAGEGTSLALDASGLTFSDPVLVGIQDNDTTTPDVIATAQILSTGSVSIKLYNPSVVDRTLAVGTRVRFIGFLSS